MKETPLLFNAPMVRSVLDGRKTQTRRVVKLPHQNPLGVWEPSTMGGEHGGRTAKGGTIPLQAVIWHTRTGDSLMCPHGQPGDRLWVRETWSSQDCMEGEALYRATAIQDGMNAGEVQEITWRPSIHMPRWTSRINLEITGVRVERLQDISEGDVIQEGCPNEILYGTGWYRDLWESINGPGSWDANHWVWVIEFQRTTA